MRETNAAFTISRSCLDYFGAERFLVFLASFWAVPAAAHRGQSVRRRRPNRPWRFAGTASWTDTTGYRSGQQPAPIGHPFQRHPNGNPKRTRQMCNRGVRCNDQIEARHRSRCVDEGISASVEIWPQRLNSQLAAQGGQLIQTVLFLQRNQADTRNGGQGAEASQRERAAQVDPG